MTSLRYRSLKASFHWNHGRVSCENFAPWCEALGRKAQGALMHPGGVFPAKRAASWKLVHERAREHRLYLKKNSTLTTYNSPFYESHTNDSIYTSTDHGADSAIAEAAKGGRCLLSHCGAGLQSKMQDQKRFSSVSLASGMRGTCQFIHFLLT